jgi:predicted metal-dependent hydrolase
MWRRSSETSDITRAKQRHIQEDGIHHSHRRQNLKFYEEKFSMIYSFNFILN